MGNIWFTADTHLGHANIIKYCKRPFKNVWEMDEVIIKNWNERVQHEDTIYHLGDLCMGDQRPYLRRLHGNKHLIRGNHDKASMITRGMSIHPGDYGWVTANDLLRIDIDKTIIILCHYAMRVWYRSHHGTLHFYGHSHGGLPGDSQCTDVGVDCWEFRPVSLEEIKQRLDKSPRRTIGHHEDIPDAPTEA